MLITTNMKGLLKTVSDKKLLRVVNCFFSKELQVAFDGRKLKLFASVF